MDLTFYCGERENKTIYSKQHRQNRVTSTAEEKKIQYGTGFWSARGIAFRNRVGRQGLIEKTTTRQSWKEER